MQSSKRADEIGSKLGPKLAELLSQTMAATHRNLGEHHHRILNRAIQDVVDRAGHEVADLYRPITKAILQDDNLHPHLREVLSKAATGKDQWQALAFLGFGTSGLQGGLSTLFSDLLAPTIRDLVSAAPYLVPSPEAAAGMAARGVIPPNEAIGWGNGQGFNDHIMEALIEVSRTYPDGASMISMFQRGLISRDEAYAIMERSGLPGRYGDALLALARTPLSPPDAALAVLRGNISQGEGARFAALYGVDAEDFNLLILNTGEPPGLMQMLEGYRRGFISQGELQKGIRESRVRNEWIPLMEKLRFAPMSTADAVNAVVQNHLTEQQAAAIAEQNGLEPGQVVTLIANAGEPLAHGQLAQLYNRGVISKAFFDQGIRESRLKNKYLDASFALREKLPTTYMIRTMLSSGAIDHRSGIRYLTDQGYSHQAAADYVNAGLASKRSGQKNLAVSTITGLYEDRAISRAEALKLLRQLKYTEQEAVWEIQLADLRAILRVTNAAVTAVRGKYVARHITEGEASVLLDEIGLPASQRDLNLKMWGIERKANVRSLTEGQVVKAVKLTLLTPHEGQARLEGMGYSQSDARLLIEGA